MLAKASPEDGIAERAKVFIATATPLVDLIISGPFKEYTLHNRDHSKKIVHLADNVISSDTLNSLSGLECLVILYSAYLHDMGLCVTFSERDRILQSPEFLDSIRSWQEVWDALEEARGRLRKADPISALTIETEIYQLQEAAISEFLRPKHATDTRYRELIKKIKEDSGRSDLFSLNGISFEDDLIQICISHNLEASVLAELKDAHEERFSRALPIGGQILNMQFCAAVLRICDILDFDRERTPRILFESLGIRARTVPGAEISLQEWRKHLSVHTIELRENEIVIFGESEHPAIEKSVRSFCSEIESEIRNTLAVVKRNPNEVLEKYQFVLPCNVRPSIKSKGYVYKELTLHLDESAIMRLLMGNELYSEPAVAARELVQNSIDACVLRSKFEQSGKYSPNIKISSHKDEDGRYWLTVDDNGIGMDEHVLTKFFFNIGRSYYSSADFERAARTHQVSSFLPISRFGIGVLSTFMIGDTLEVRTRSSHSMHQDSARRTIRVERMGSLAYVTEDSHEQSGTRVQVRLKQLDANSCEALLNRIASYLETNVLRPACEITVNIGTFKYSITPRRFYYLLPNAQKVLDSKNLNICHVSLERWSSILSGNVFLIFGNSTHEGKLSHMEAEKKITFSQGLSAREDKYVFLKPGKILDDYEGNRVSVNGFRMGIKKLSRLFQSRSTKASVVCIFDVEVAAGPQIVFDVSRTRIIGKGSELVRAEIRNAIISALEGTGLLERLDDETRRLISPTK